MSQALAELGKQLERLQKTLEKNADDFGGERFGQENPAMAEMMKKLGDLEGDQRAVAGDSQALARSGREMAKKRAAELDKAVAGAREKLEALRKKLAGATPRDLGERRRTS